MRVPNVGKPVRTPKPKPVEDDGAELDRVFAELDAIEAADRERKPAAPR